MIRDTRDSRALTLEHPLTAFDIVAPSLLFLAVVAVRQLMVVPMMHGSIVNFDEELYIRFARSIFMHGSYRSPQYPPLFPALMASAFLAGENWYEAMKITVNVIASLTVFPTYYLARVFVDRWSSMAIAILVAVTMAGHLVLSLAVMSENLYHPLFLLAILLSLGRLPRRAWVADVVFGAVLGALYLTRYISLVAIPVFLIGWLLRELDDDRRAPAKVLAARLGLVVCTAAAVFSPWLLNTLWTEATFKDALGFVIASNTDPAQLTLDRLLFFAAAYLSFFILLAAPTLHLLIHSARRAVRERRGPYARFVLLVAMLTTAFGLAMVRHSWRADYNYPEPARIVSRYGIYIALTFTILAAVTFVRLIRSGQRPRPAVVIGVFLTHSALLVAAYSFLMTDALGGTGGRLLRQRSGVDFLRLYEIGWPVIGIAVVFSGLTAAALLTRARPLRRWLVPGFLIGLIAWSAWGLTSYYDLMARHERYAFHARQLAAMAQAANLTPSTVFVGREVEDSFELGGAGWSGQFRSGMRMFGLRVGRIDVGDNGKPQLDSEYPVLILRGGEARESGTEIGRYEFRDQEFVVSIETTSSEGTTRSP